VAYFGDNMNDWLKQGDSPCSDKFADCPSDCTRHDSLRGCSLRGYVSVTPCPHLGGRPAAKAKAEGWPCVISIVDSDGLPIILTPITAATVMITDRNIHQDQSAGDVQ